VERKEEGEETSLILFSENKGKERRKGDGNGRANICHRRRKENALYSMLHFGGDLIHEFKKEGGKGKKGARAPHC